MSGTVDLFKGKIRASKVYHRFRSQLRALLRIDGFGRIWLLRNARARIARGAIRPFMKQRRLADLTIFEQRVYSQNGEDGILKVIFMKVGTTNKFCVEFGVGDGKECNTRYLTEKEGWHALLMDTNERAPPSVKREFITPANINNLFLKYSVPEQFDLLSVDLDYNTYWVWKAIEGFRPRVVVIEYNGLIAPDQAKVVQFDPQGVWDGTDYFGASLLALEDLGREKGYSLVACDRMGVNAFFVRTELVEEGHFRVGNAQELFKSPTYHYRHSANNWFVPARQNNGNNSK